MIIRKNNKGLVLLSNHALQLDKTEEPYHQIFKVLDKLNHHQLK